MRGPFLFAYGNIEKLIRQNNLIVSDFHGVGFTYIDMDGVR